MKRREYLGGVVLVSTSFSGCLDIISDEEVTIGVSNFGLTDRFSLDTYLEEYGGLIVSFDRRTGSDVILSQEMEIVQSEVDIRYNLQQESEDRNIMGSKIHNSVYFDIEEDENSLSFVDTGSEAQSVGVDFISNNTFLYLRLSSFSDSSVEVNGLEENFEEVLYISDVDSRFHPDNESFSKGVIGVDGDEVKGILEYEETTDEIYISPFSFDFEIPDWTDSVSNIDSFVEYTIDEEEIRVSEIDSSLIDIVAEKQIEDGEVEQISISESKSLELDRSISRIYIEAGGFYEKDINLTNI